jgi:hypothetical protein
MDRGRLYPRLWIVQNTCRFEVGESVAPLVRNQEKKALLLVSGRPWLLLIMHGNLELILSRELERGRVRGVLQDTLFHILARWMTRTERTPPSARPGMNSMPNAVYITKCI